MQIRLLGPVQLVVDDAVIDLGPPKQRGVLAALAWERGRSVLPRTVVDRVWGDEAPEHALDIVYTYIARLRRIMSSAAGGQEPCPVVAKDSQGYRLLLDPGAVDVVRYRHLIQRSRERAAATERASVLLEAIDMWRGQPLHGIPGDWARRVREGLAQQHIGALADWAAAAMAIGVVEPVINRLFDAIEANPHAEPIVEQLMIALYRSGRTEQALTEYTRFRNRMVNQFGIDPGPKLRQLQTYILQHDPDIADTQVSASSRQPPSVGAELPAWPPVTRYARSGEVHIAYQIVSKRRPGRPDIVFVPGVFSHLDLWWEDPVTTEFFTRVAELGRLIMFDQRDTGLSDRVVAEHSLDERMDDVRAVLDACGCDRAVLIGSSEGGPMIIRFAVTHPGRVAGLVLGGTAARWSPAPDYPCGRRIEQMLNAYEDIVKHSWGQGTSIDWVCPSLSHSRKARELIARRERMSVSPADVLRMVKMVRRIDVRSDLPAVDSPALVIQRLHDRLAPRCCGQHLAAHLPNVRYVEQPGDHVIWLGDTDTIIRELDAFFAGLAEGERAPDRRYRRDLDRRQSQISAPIPQ